MHPLFLNVTKITYYQPKNSTDKKLAHATTINATMIAIGKFSKVNISFIWLSSNPINTQPI